MNIQDLELVSFDGHVLNDATYGAEIPIDVPPQAEAGIVAVPRAGTFPKYAGFTLDGRTLPIHIYSKDGSGVGNLIEWFPIDEKDLKVLVVRNKTDDSLWYWNARVKSTPRLKYNKLEVIFWTDDPIWRSDTMNSVSWNITGTGQTNDFTVGGNRFARPIFRVGPTSPRTGGFGYVRYVALANRIKSTYIDSLNLADGDWNTAALVSGGKMLSSGNDLRIFSDVSGQEVYRWFGGGGINSTTTRPVVNVTLPAMIYLTLSGSIASSGAVSTISVKNTSDNKAALAALAKQPYKVLAIDLGNGQQEIFTYTDVNLNALQITGVTRAQKLSAMMSHSDGAAIRHVTGYWVMYGNSSMDAPGAGDDYLPMYVLSSFANASRSLTSFYAPLQPERLGQFFPKIIKNVGEQSHVYTADHVSYADVATEMGMAIRAFLSGTSWKAPTATLAWDFYHPAGMTNVSMDGEKYRKSTGFPIVAALKKSTNGSTYSSVANEAAPATANVWTALATLTGSKSLSGTFSYIRFEFGGTVAAGIAENYAAIELDNLVLTLDSANLPLIWFGSENNNNYEDFRITNNTNGHWLEVSYPVPVNDAIIIDTENLEAYRESDGSAIPIRLDDENRVEWLPFEPGVVNTLQYDETGANALTIDTEWEDRNQ